MWRSSETGDGFGVAAAETSAAAAPILLWCEHTVGVVRPTGVQRVVRNLARELGAAARPVGWDRWRGTVRALSPQETHGLCPGRAHDTTPVRRGGGWLLVPETPSPAGPDPVRVAQAYGWRVAVLVHDIIPVTAPEPYEPETVALYGAYVRSLVDADLVITTTQHVAAHLRRVLAEERLEMPPLTVVPLAAELPGIARVAVPISPREGAPLRFLTTSRWEPRKNLPRLLRAIGRARAGGRDIRLTLVGRRGGFPEHEALLDRLLASMPWVTAPHETRDAALPDLYARHEAAIYASLDEGFGLPVLESLWLGRACLHHAGSAMAEVAPGGGTLGLDMRDETAIAAVLCRLFDDPALLAGLSREATGRPLRRWADVAADIRSTLDAAG